MTSSTFHTIIGQKLHSRCSPNCLVSEFLGENLVKHSRIPQLLLLNNKDRLKTHETSQSPCLKIKPIFASSTFTRNFEGSTEKFIYDREGIFPRTVVFCGSRGVGGEWISLVNSSFKLTPAQNCVHFNGSINLKCKML